MPLVILAVLIVALSWTPLLAQDTTLTFDRPETAGISGLRSQWNVPVPLREDGAVQFSDAIFKGRAPTAVWSPVQRAGRPGAIAFDALNRSLLVRFPGLLGTVLDRIRQGYAIQKLELVLPFRDTELWPPGNPNFAPPDGYLYRTNWGVDELYRKLPPRWHAVAWILRRPWQADAKWGPTFNAYINGVGFWTKYGAGDEQQDRFPARFGPAEISENAPEGRIDVTALVNDPRYGETLASRLRHLDCCGFVVSKLESYDARYYGGAYEWGTATGGRAILVRTPKLVATLSRSGARDSHLQLGSDDPALNIAALAEQLKSDGSGGQPTATLPSNEDLSKLATTFGSKPAWMSATQIERISDLRRLSGKQRIDKPFFYDLLPDFQLKHLGELRGPGKEAAPSEVFGAWVDSILGRQPRGWSGFEPASEMTQWFAYGDALPGPARDAFKRYWTAWLMPDRASAPQERQLDRTLLDGSLVHPQIDQLTGGFESAAGLKDSYYAMTGDWQGNKSFYRAGYTRSMSTQNFNHTAALGALLGGAVINSPTAMADGRHGWEHYPARLWAWSQGASQENIDHYYLPITVSAQKVAADYGPTPFDRLLSQGLLAKSLDELIAAYHPALRRFVASSSRTSLEYLLAEQDGLQYILHTLSRTGALHDVNNPEIKTLLPGLQSVIGEEVPPLRVAMQSRAGRWAPDWATNLVDEKPLPYRAQAATDDGIATSYLGHNYGVATATQTRRIQFLAQWRREEKPAERMSEVVTVVAHYGINDTRFANDSHGWIAPIGSETFLQHDNKVLMLASPRNARFLHEKAKQEGLRSLQSSIALFNYQQPTPDWEIYVDGERVTKLPHSTRAGAKITIRDGASFLGVVALPGTDLGGGNTVTLRQGTAQEWNKISFKPALVIDAYNLKSEQPVADPDWDRIDKAFGGFAIELGDRDEYGSFEIFQKHFAKVELHTRAEGLPTLSVSYKSGADVLETSALTTGEELNLVSPKINGKPAFLPAGILRDTSTSVQGTAAAIEKAGGVLRGEQGRMKFLQVEPATGTYVAWNPLPDLTKFSFLIPGGAKIQSDGRIGLGRVEVDANDQLTVTHVWKEGQDKDPTAATALVLTGFQRPPKVEFNGAVQGSVTTRMVNGQSAYIVPLQNSIRSAAEMERSLND
jgi:hypothetical protein